MFLTKKIAENIIHDYISSDYPSKEEEQAWIDATIYLAEEHNEYENYSSLGGYYYSLGRYDLSLKYHLIADSYNIYDSSNSLGYIYYYGRAGDVDYKKAMYYFTRAYKEGKIDEAGIKIADMYHFGFGVKQDETKYQKMLFEIYKKYKVVRYVGEPVPELAHRIGKIYLDNGDLSKARKILFLGLSVIEQRLRFNTFWGNMVIAKRLIELYHQIVPLNEGHLTFIDLFIFFQKPNVVVLRINNKKYFIEAYMENNEIRVKFLDKVFSSVQDFYANCMIDNKTVNIIEANVVFDMVSLDYETEFQGLKYGKE